jgi:hypothetical protein
MNRDPDDERRTIPWIGIVIYGFMAAVLIGSVIVFAAILHNAS